MTYASVRRDITESVYTYAVHGCVDLREVCWQRLSTGAVAKWVKLGLFRETSGRLGPTTFVSPPLT